jgi:hypothetical protein
MSDPEPLPVTVSVGDVEMDRFIVELSLGREGRFPVRVELDNGDEIQLPRKFIEPLLEAHQTTND